MTGERRPKGQTFGSEEFQNAYVSRNKGVIRAELDYFMQQL